MKFLYTDIDGVLSLMSETTQKMTEWGPVTRFNPKAVKVYNRILEETGAIPVISSDWKLFYTLEQLQGIFTKFAGITIPPIGITPDLWGTEFTSLDQLEECRSKEIMMHVEQFKPDNWVAIDDIDLSKALDLEITKNHFVHLPLMNEGIKQTGKEKKIIELLNKI